MELIRSFVAVEIPPSQKMDRLQRELSRVLDAKLVELENLHITLIFLGEIPKQTVDQVTRALSSIQFRKFSIELKGIGVFPREDNPRVVWIGVSKGREELTRLAQLVRESVEKYSRHREEREFTPHLTIARLKSRKNIDKLAKMIDEYREEVFGEVEIREVKLKRSILTPRGPIYSDLYVLNLSD